MVREDAILEQMVEGMIGALEHDPEFLAAAARLKEDYVFKTDELIPFVFKAIKLGYEHRILEEAAEGGVIDPLPLELDDDAEGVLGVKMATLFIAENA